MNRFSAILLSAAIAAIAIMPVAAQAKARSASFSGIVNHVSTDNIKVTNNKTHETLSFLILPKFDQIFSADGKTTYQMKAIKAGQYVKVYYDQKMLGARHADRILLLTAGNGLKRTE